MAEQAISGAYTMCAGVQNAAPETHATIVATLLVPSGTGPVQVPTGSSTVASSQTSAQGSATESATTNTLITMSATVPPTSTAKSTSSSASSPSVTADSTPDLNTAQIAGISVGIAATLGLAVGLIFLARCIRKRNFGDQESVLFRPERTSKGFGMLKSNQNSPRNLQISAPIPQAPIDMEFRRPGDFQRHMMPKPGIIGLAVSPPRSATATSQEARAEEPMSINQPPQTYAPYRPGEQDLPKPALTLSIPQNLSHEQNATRTLQSSRESVMTEFQEDGEGDGLGAANTWRPPHTDPQSTTTYYVADRWDNWVKSNTDRDSRLPELPSAMNEEQARRDMDLATGFPVDGMMPNPGARQMSKRAPTPRNVPAARLGPPIEFKDGEQALRSSSVYSAYNPSSSLVATPRNHLQPDLLQVASAPAQQRANAARTKGQDLGKRQMLKPGSRQNKRRSQDSATTISSSVAEENGEGAAVEGDPHDGLSPVVESPRTPVSRGEDPVVYAERSAAASETPGRRGQQGHKQLLTPPKRLQPTLTLFPRPARNETVSPPPLSHLEQRAVNPQENTIAVQLSGTAKQQSARPSGLNPNPQRNPAAFKTGSPEMRSGSAPPESQRQRRPSPLHRQQPYRQHHGRGSSLQLQQRLQDPQATQPGPHGVPGRGDLESTVAQERLGQTGLSMGMSNSPASAKTAGIVDSAGSSSLLTKRLGADSAAALTLRGDVGGRSTQRVKWQRDQGPSESQGPGTTTASAAMPGWLPKLTPTKRGDDLFLNVQ